MGLLYDALSSCTAGIFIILNLLREYIREYFPAHCRETHVLLFMSLFKHPLSLKAISNINACVNAILSSHLLHTLSITLENISNVTSVTAIFSLVLLCLAWNHVNYEAGWRNSNLHQADITNALCSTLKFNFNDTDIIWECRLQSSFYVHSVFCENRRVQSFLCFF